MNTTSFSVGRILRAVAAVAIVISGIVHLDLYFNYRYRFAGDAPNFGRSILLNAIASGVIAAALVWRTEWYVRAAGILFGASTIAAFAYTHSGHKFFGFDANSFEPSPQAQIALVVQIAAILLLAATFLPAIATADESLGPIALGIAGVVAAVALVGLTIRWKSDDSASAAAGASNVTIQNFSFSAKDATVAKGTTVTWTNDDKVTHSVVATDTSFISQNLATGDTFRFTFDTDGTFSYICGIHPSMSGTITVAG